MSLTAAEDHDAERRRAAAFRLKHDLGKYVRFHAPREREQDPEALRERLARDLGETRSGANGSASAVEVFGAWEREEGALFSATDPDLRELRRLMGELTTLLPALPSLGAEQLLRLDELSKAVTASCVSLHRRVAADARVKT